MLFTKRFAIFVCISLTPFLPCSSASAWSEAGHHVIAGLAFQMLSPDEQQILIELLKSHPQFAVEFVIPESVATPEEGRLWLCGRAGYWPDVARRYAEFNRPKWHYQLGSSLVIGNVSTLEVDSTPQGLPFDVTMQTRELHIAQALALSNNTLSNPSSSAEEKALAVCWIAHLVADAHQPCHAGSLYAEIVFPRGDQGGNAIPTKQSANLHALWDGLLGRRYNSTVKRRMHEISNDDELRSQVEDILERGSVSPSQWLAESRQLAARFVYPSEILNHVLKAQEDGTSDLERIELSESYLKNAGGVAQRQALLAAHRLSATWSKALQRGLNLDPGAK